MCQACDHPERLAIEAHMRKGYRPSAIGQLYGLPAASIYQHWLKHAKPLPIDPNHARLDATPDESSHEPVSPPSHIACIDSPTTRLIAAIQVGRPVMQPMERDALGRCKYHLAQAAAAWQDVEPPHRTWERLQLLLQDAFADEEMGL